MGSYNKETKKKEYTRLCRKAHFLAKPLASNDTSSSHLPQRIVIEKVTVQRRLDSSGNPANPVAVVLFRHVSRNPIADVECTVQTEQNHIIRCQVLNFLVSLKHDNLGHNADRFQVNRETPRDLPYYGSPTHTSRIRLSV